MTAVETPAGQPVAVAADSVVVLHDLTFRPEEDGAWVVGRAATGEFVELPAEAKTVIDLLTAGRRVGEAKREADRRHDADLDVADFVGDLVELGFVATVDGRPADAGAAAPQPPSLPRLRPGHVRWVFTPPVAIVLAAYVAVGFGVALHDQVMPTFRSFFAFSHPGVNALTAMVLSWSNAALHEFWHLAAARAAGIGGRIGFGTRLTFLVAQTSVPGLWAADRRARLRFYVAGMISDLVVVSTCLLIAASTPTGSVAHRITELISLTILLSFLLQFAVYVRTDVYLIVQELTGCKNLHGDATARLRWWAAGLRSRGARSRGPDPTDGLPQRERRPVRIYAVVVALGSTVTLAEFGFFQLPILAVTIYRSAREVAVNVPAGAVPQIVDGTIMLVVPVVTQALFIRTLTRRIRARRRAL
ncbi:hypothetical protein [Catenulispora subtropica]|uniref:PqqD family protein n=1 Tax=Catenulispora subtropica TaxID=450798 RepID=A0ABN2S608_9ACTN